MIVTRRRASLAQFTPCILGLVHLGCGRGHWPPSGGTDSACSKSGNHGGYELFWGDGRVEGAVGEEMKRREIRERKLKASACLALVLKVLL